MLVRKSKVKPSKPKKPLPQPSLERYNGNGKSKHDLEKEWLQAKIDLTRRREQSATIILAKAREELIEKSVAQRQAAFLYTAMRQKFLAIPTTYARRLLHKSDITEVVGILKEGIYKALEEVSELPRRIIDPEYQKTLEWVPNEFKATSRDS
jgi:phage terminase Nu1 subunit (DNA packaging protein)